MSVSKLLSRIIESTNRQNSDDVQQVVFDPLTQFASIFSALCHDVDHPGVSNAQLIEENSPLATAYNGKSIAEQNSVDVTWKLFTDARFAEFRTTVCKTDLELFRFRQLVVNW